MNREVHCDGVAGKRSALGDLTNTNGKRGAPLASGKFVIGNQIVKNLESTADNAGSSKRSRKGPENVSKGGSGFTTSFGIKACENFNPGVFSEYKNDGHKTGMSPLKAKHILQSVASSHNDEPRKGSELSSALNPGKHFIRGNVVPHGTIQSTEVRESFNSFGITPGQREDDRNNSITEECFEEDSTICRAGVVENVVDVDTVDRKEFEAGVGNLSTLTDSSAEFTSEQLNNATTSVIKILSQESSNRSCVDGGSPQPFGLPGRMGSNIEGDHSTPNFSGDPPSFHIGDNPSSCKDCSCSFCSKAAYVWADLLYHDARGRLAEVKRSKRQASILVGKSYVRDVGHGSTVKTAEKFKKFTNMEYDLMNRWRSLFVKTEKILQCEGTQLQEDILRIRKLRANRKKELEMTVGMISSNLQGASDDSD